MAPSLQQKLDTLLLELLELPEKDRRSALERADADLRREAESFLSVLPEAESFFDQFAPPAAPAPIEGRRIGPYEVTGTLGAGGMGRVYRARRADGQFQSEVAIKIVSPLALGAEAQRRFAQEKQLLANLKHENIAAIYDAGVTTDGLPYLVMELVEGQPLDRYCHDLPVHQKLEVFIQVCHAVAFAHQRLIVHRDLKPGNVLVTREGQVKLLDFGIAKVLSDSDLFETTLPENRVMTLATASPEQIRGETVTTASDVYSLGVILYQTLTGATPFAGADLNLTERIRRVCDEDPAPPSQTVPSLAGDLDNITAKALRKDPHERYHSARDFADDVQRFLDGRPVAATPPTLLYRARKYVRRNRIGVAAAFIVVSVLAAAVYSVVDSARIARQERDAAVRSRHAAEAASQLAESRRIAAENAQQLAEANRQIAEAQTKRAIASEREALRRFDDVRSLALKIIFQYQDKLATVGTATDLRKRMIEDSLGYLDKLASEKALDARMRFSLALSYVELAKAQGVGQNQLGDRPGALASLEKAQQQLDVLLRIDPRNLGYRRNAAELTCWFFSFKRRTGEQCLDGWRAVARDYPDDRMVMQGVAYALYAVANIPAQASPDREKYLLEYLAIKQRILETNREDTSAWRDVALGHKNLSSLYSERGQIEPARDHAQRAVEIDERIVAKEGTPRARMDLAISYSVLGDTFYPASDWTRYVELLEKSVKEREAVAQQDPANQFYRERLFIGRVSLATGYRLGGRAGDILALLNRADQDLRRGPAGNIARWRGNFHRERAFAYTEAGRDAATICQEVKAAADYYRQGDPENQLLFWRKTVAEKWPACPVP